MRLFLAQVNLLLAEQIVLVCFMNTFFAFFFSGHDALGTETSKMSSGSLCVGRERLSLGGKGQKV